ncbi:MAG: hypothetical protein U5K77_00495 [Candidatus Saccharibacteria bacterium]|nr:hypothetical protein [Candidatus Saccharibacteria bacterium]
MTEVQVEQREHKDDVYVFAVRVDGNIYRVRCSDDYYRMLTESKIDPEQLVEKSFVFLLEREPASSILSEFDLPLISNYFPEYESTIKRMVG